MHVTGPELKKNKIQNWVADSWDRDLSIAAIFEDFFFCTCQKKMKTILDEFSGFWWIFGFFWVLSAKMVFTHSYNYVSCTLWPCHRDFEIVPNPLVDRQNTFGYPQLRIFRLGLRSLRPKLTSLHHFESRLFSQNRMFSVQNEWDLGTFWGPFLNFAELWARVLEKKSFSRKNNPATGISHT